MKNLFVTYEIAKQLKELGFNEKCFGFYNYQGELIINDCSISFLEWFKLVEEAKDTKNIKIIPAILYQQVIDWFREEKNIHIQMICTNDLGIYYAYILTKKKGFDTGKGKYYDVLAKAIEEAIKLIKSK